MSCMKQDQPSNQVSDCFSPSRVKKWASDDLTRTLSWLESQDEKVCTFYSWFYQLQDGGMGLLVLSISCLVCFLISFIAYHGLGHLSKKDSMFCHCIFCIAFN